MIELFIINKLLKEKVLNNHSRIFTPSDRLDFTPSDRLDFTPSDRFDFTPSDRMDFTPSDRLDFTPSDRLDFIPFLFIWRAKYSARGANA